MHGAADEGGNTQSRGSINRRVPGKNQRDGPSGSQARGGGTPQLNASSSQNKQAQGHSATVGHAAATGVNASTSKNSRQLAPNMSQGTASAQQQRSNSKAYNNTDDN